MVENLDKDSGTGEIDVFAQKLIGIPRHAWHGLRRHCAGGIGMENAADPVDKSQPRWRNLPRNTPHERGRYLASIVCAECHGADFLGDPLEGGPPLTILWIYDEQEFARLVKTALSQTGVLVEPQSL
jgi:hypothetical protein